MIRDLIAIQDYVREVRRDSPMFFSPGWDATAQMVDQSGQGNHGTYTGGVTLGQAGPIGRGRSGGFDGSTGYGSVGTFDLGTTFSLECWVRWAGGTSGYQGIISKRTSYGASTMRWQLGLSDDTSFGPLYRYQFESTTGHASASVAPVIGAWEHVVVTYAAGTATICRNCVAIGTGSVPLDNLQTATNTIGMYQPGNGEGFNGAIANVSFYMSILSPGRIAAHYNALANPRSRRVFYFPKTFNAAWFRVPRQTMEAA